VQSEKEIWFRTICLKNGIALTDFQIELMSQYVNLLLEWNKKINLISRKDEENIWTYHILHCVSPLFKVKIVEGSRIVDIGTGGGLPSVPIKIIRPDISFCCIDATRKKVNAVSQIIDKLKLKAIQAIWGRAEDTGMQSDFRCKFDFVIARAVCQLKDLISLSISFLKTRTSSLSPEPITINGLIDPEPPALIAFKGGELKQEVDLAKGKFPSMTIASIDLAFMGSEQLIASDKKILVVHL
jgi:16S rRNA (guanine527-N7)-methyltransferase